LSAASQYERALTSVRVREGMARRKAEGVHLGRRTELPTEVLGRIVASRAERQSLQFIADGLNADGVPTAHGGAKWHPSTVKAVLGSAAALALI
jgi:DNA invertase Pin-like site-specific DNA recombinase